MPVLIGLLAFSGIGMLWSLSKDPILASFVKSVFPLTVFAGFLLVLAFVLIRLVYIYEDKRRMTTPLTFSPVFVRDNVVEQGISAYQISQNGHQQVFERHEKIIRNVQLMDY